LGEWLGSRVKKTALLQKVVCWGQVTLQVGTNWGGGALNQVRMGKLFCGGEFKERIAQREKFLCKGDEHEDGGGSRKGGKAVVKKRNTEKARDTIGRRKICGKMPESRGGGGADLGGQRKSVAMARGCPEGRVATQKD